MAVITHSTLISCTNDDFTDGSYTTPNGVTKIADYAFVNCTSFTNIIISNGVAEISMYPFRYRPTLATVSIPESVTLIADWAFSNCTGLKTVTIAGSVAGISSSVFHNCTSINRFNIDKDAINQLDANGKSLLERFVADDHAPPNVIKALIFAGADVTSKVIQAAKRPEDKAQINRWHEEYKEHIERVEVNNFLLCFRHLVCSEDRAPVTGKPNENHVKGITRDDFTPVNALTQHNGLALREVRRGLRTITPRLAPGA